MFNFKKEEKEIGIKSYERPLIVYIAVIIFFLCVTMYASGFLSQLIMIIKMGMDTPIGTAINLPSVNTSILFCIKTGAFTQIGWTFDAIITICAALALIAAKKKASILGNEKGTDERGVTYSSGSNYGSASVMTEKEATQKDRLGRTFYEVTPVKEARGYIVGMFDTEGKKTVAISPTSPLNANVAIFGSPGTGKSRGFIRNKMLQAVKRQESCVITDPKGELYQTMSEYFRENGYVVKLYNLRTDSLEHSDSWNCLKEVFDPETEEVTRGQPLYRLDEVFFTVTKIDTDHCCVIGYCKLCPRKRY